MINSLKMEEEILIMGYFGSDGFATEEKDATGAPFPLMTIEQHQRILGNKKVLTVWYGKMPESNGKSNWTAILMRKGDSLLFGPHMTIARSEYPDRVRYEADCVRHMIGELEEEPDMMSYDHDLHSGYKKKYDETKAHYYAECRDMFPRNSEAWNALNDKLLAMFEGL